MLLSFDFTYVQRDAILRVLKNSPSELNGQIAVSVALPGDTVLTDDEALHLADLVEPYYHFIATGIRSHPAFTPAAGDL